MADNKINFEKSLEELEKIIEKLESGECSLEESIVLFEQGVKYTGECRTALKEAKEKIVSLSEFEKSEDND